jgi:molybdopterin converting factor small subunit
MQVDLDLYGPYRDAVGRKRLVRDVPSGATVGDLLSAVLEDYPELADGLLAEDGSVGRSATVTVDGTPISRADGPETTLPEDCVVRITPPIKGG